MMLLFDIDGTLLRSHGAGRRALVRAFDRVLGIQSADAFAGIRLDGSTDPLIVAHAFDRAAGRAPRDPPEVERILDAYLAFLEDELARLGDRYEVLPGARAMAAAASGSGRHVVGLATGNIERGARMKLAPGDLNRYFAFGGFGSDAAEREEIVRCAVRRGQVQAEGDLGRRCPPHEIFVLGDTEKDVAAARAAGATSVGVLAGSFSEAALRASSPDLLAGSLEDPELWRALGVPSPSGGSGA